MKPRRTASTTDTPGSNEDTVSNGDQRPDQRHRDTNGGGGGGGGDDDDDHHHHQDDNDDANGDNGNEQSRRSMDTS